MFVEMPNRKSSLAEAKHALGRGSRWINSRGRSSVSARAERLWVASRDIAIPFQTRVVAANIAATIDAAVTLSEAAGWSKMRREETIRAKSPIGRGSPVDSIVASSSDGAILGSAQWMCEAALAKARLIRSDAMLGGIVSPVADHIERSLTSQSGARPAKRVGG